MYTMLLLCGVRLVVPLSMVLVRAGLRELAVQRVLVRGRAFWGQLLGLPLPRREARVAPRHVAPRHALVVHPAPRRVDGARRGKERLAPGTLLPGFIQGGRNTLQNTNLAEFTFECCTWHKLLLNLCETNPPQSV